MDRFVWLLARVVQYAVHNNMVSSDYNISEVSWDLDCVTVVADGRVSSVGRYTRFCLQGFRRYNKPRDKR